MPPTPRFTLQGAWVRLDASLVEQWVNGEAEVELDLLDVGRVKVAVTQREVVDERFVILRGYLQGQSQSRVTLRMPRRMVGLPKRRRGAWCKCRRRQLISPIPRWHNRFRPRQ